MSYEDLVIVKSQLQCLECEDVIVSKHRHDFVRCKCGSAFLDGGIDYVRYGGKDLSRMKVMTTQRNKYKHEVLSDVERYSKYWQDANSAYMENYYLDKYNEAAKHYNEHFPSGS